MLSGASTRMGMAFVIPIFFLLEKRHFPSRVNSQKRLASSTIESATPELLDIAAILKHSRRCALSTALVIDWSLSTLASGTFKLSYANLEYGLEGLIPAGSPSINTVELLSLFFILKTLSKRETGFEPATFSLEG